MIYRLLRDSEGEDASLMASLAFSANEEERARVRERSAEDLERQRLRYRSFIEHDPDGALVAVDGFEPDGSSGSGGRIVGMAVSLRRESVWVLSIFAVDAEYRSTGVGRELLRRSLEYGAGCTGAMIASSTYPAAMRSYSRSGFELHPTLKATGTVRREAIPGGLKAREGSEDDLELAEGIGRKLRGASHGPDLGLMLRTGSRLFVHEGRAGETGFAVGREGSTELLAATTPEVATGLLWSVLEEAGEEEISVRWLSSSQQWALPVVLDAGLALENAGPLCLRGRLGPLTPYLPSGPYL